MVLFKGQRGKLDDSNPPFHPFLDEEVWVKEEFIKFT